MLKNATQPKTACGYGKIKREVLAIAILLLHITAVISVQMGPRSTGKNLDEGVARMNEDGSKPHQL